LKAGPYPHPRARRLTVAFLLLCSATGLAAEENPCLKRTIPVHVLDVEGKPVSGLLAGNFRAKYRGRPVQIPGFSTDVSARRIVLLLDASGSITDTTTVMWRAEQVLAADLMLHGPQPSSLALMVFASEVEDKVGFAQGPLAVAKRLETLRAERDPVPGGHGKTALYDAILAGLAELKPARFGDVIYVITDGGDNQSRSKPSEVERALVTQGVRLFVVLFNNFTPARGRAPGDDPSILRGLVERSGGVCSMVSGDSSVVSGDSSLQTGFTERRLADTVAAARPLYKEMREFYRLEIELPEEVDKPRKWKLEVSTDRGKKKEHFLAFYPELFPCSAGHEQLNQSKTRP
jgi:von Willebrand factor type A domain-containing protein